MKELDIDCLLGKTLMSIAYNGDRELIFCATDGVRYRMYHHQSCCEEVSLDDICGDLNHLVGSPILLAEEIVYENEELPRVKRPASDESFTWTFYKIGTVKGYVTLRWYGGSNGYYSERVSFEEYGACE